MKFFASALWFAAVASAISLSEEDDQLLAQLMEGEELPDEVLAYDEIEEEE